LEDLRKHKETLEQELERERANNISFIDESRNHPCCSKFAAEFAEVHKDLKEMKEFQEQIKTKFLKSNGPEEEPLLQKRDKSFAGPPDSNKIFIVSHDDAIRAAEKESIRWFVSRVFKVKDYQDFSSYTEMPEEMKV